MSIKGQITASLTFTSAHFSRTVKEVTDGYANERAWLQSINTLFTEVGFSPDRAEHQSFSKPRSKSIITRIHTSLLYRTSSSEPGEVCSCIPPTLSSMWDIHGDTGASGQTNRMGLSLRRESF